MQSALLFAVVNISDSYELTNKLIPLELYNKEKKCPTNLGILFHTLVFFIMTYCSMGKSELNNDIKLKHTIYGTLLFFFVSSPTIYSVLSSFLGKEYATINGCYTLLGLLFHTVIFCILLIGLMYLPE